MRRGQAGTEAALVALLLVALIAAAAHAGADAWQRATASIEASRRGQALVELIALCPIIAACACAFAIACGRVAAVARAEAALARAVRADAAGLTPAPTPGVRVRIDGRRIEVRVRAPLGEVARVAQRVG